MKKIDIIQRIKKKPFRQEMNNCRYFNEKIFFDVYIDYKLFNCIKF